MQPTWLSPPVTFLADNNNVWSTFFNYLAAKLWNSLPAGLRALEDLYDFKRTILGYVILTFNITSMYLYINCKVHRILLYFISVLLMYYLISM